jgi:hypothetical protein
MPDRKKKSTAKRQPKKRTVAQPNAPVKATAESKPTPRAGMPAHDSIISETTFVSPKGRTYRIIKTNEIDAYDDEEPQPTRKRRRTPRR